MQRTNAGQRDHTDLPCSDDILAVFRAGAGSADSTLIEVADRLRSHHAQQWEAEDRCRMAASDDEVLARAKRQIDRMNMTRSQLVE